MILHEQHTAVHLYRHAQVLLGVQPSVFGEPIVLGGRMDLWSTTPGIATSSKDATSSKGTPWR